MFKISRTPEVSERDSIVASVRRHMRIVTLVLTQDS